MSAMFYLKSLAVMFVAAVPIAAVLAAVFGAIVPEDPSAPKSIGALLVRDLQALYLLAWPLVLLLSVVHTAAVHAVNNVWGLRSRWIRLALGVGAGLVFGIAIGVLRDFSVRSLVTVVVDYALLGGVYGFIGAILVPLPNAVAGLSKGV